MAPLIDQCSAQRYTVFAVFVNLYLSTGKTFYKGCAEVFLSPKLAVSNCAPAPQNSHQTTDDATKQMD